MADILNVLKRRILVYDGAMGTMLQAQGLSAGACPEEWNLRCPQKVLSVHKAYSGAGADIVETNTFGANRMSLEKYGLGGECRRINRSAVRIAKKAAKYTAGAVGPLPGMTAPLGKVDFDTAVSVFKEQIKALSSAGADIIVLETFSDIKELKAAVIACRDVCRLPIQAQMTFSEDGRTISGTNAESAVSVLEAMGVDIIGANCSLGPKGLFRIIKRIAAVAGERTFISALPNAGLPKPKNGRAVFNMRPSVFAGYAERYYKMGVNLIGGCCGTAPAHIAAVSRRIKGMKPVKRACRKKYFSAAGRTGYIEFSPEGEPYIIGERINPSRRKALTEELLSQKTRLVKKEAQEQVRNGAVLLDVNVSIPGVDEPGTMARAVAAVESVSDVPLVIDSGSPNAIEAGLKQCAGKAVINSVNGEKRRLRSILPLAKKYGAGIIALTMDEDGIPMTAGGRIKIAERIIKEAVCTGISKEDILIDFLTLTAGAQPESTEVTLSCLKEARRRGWQTILGISNVSFGLPERRVINTAFFAAAAREGLTAAIINPSSLAPFRMLFGGRASAAVSSAPENKNPLYNCVLQGDKDNICACVESYLASGRDPLEVSGKILAPALFEVGRRFEKREYFLPQLLLSAEAMQKAMVLIEKKLSGKHIRKKKAVRVLMATVKGDMHDIGKNIVCTVLRNYGYEIVDMGRDVSCEKILKKAKDGAVDIIGLSALMTTTMGQMETVINGLKEKGIEIPVIIGGAVVTAGYAKKIGAAGYARDVMSAVGEVAKITGK